jgi:hypothetical protein
MNLTLLDGLRAGFNGLGRVCLGWLWFFASFLSSVKRYTFLLVLLGDVFITANTQAQPTLPEYTFPGAETKPKETGYRWCPNSQGDIVLTFYFAKGLNRSDFLEETYRTAIRDAIDYWNDFVLLNIFEGQFRLVAAPGTMSFDPKTQCPPSTLNNAIIFTMGALEQGRPSNCGTFLSSPLSQQTGCSIPLPSNKDEVSAGWQWEDYYDDQILGSNKKQFRVAFIDFNDKVYLSGCYSLANLTETAKHEIGHALGIGHMDCTNTPSRFMMCNNIISPFENPYISNGEVAVLSHIYGRNQLLQWPESIGEVNVDNNGRVFFPKYGTSNPQWSCLIIPPIGRLTTRSVVEREYSLFFNENNGAFTQFAKIKSDDWINNSFNHSFSKSYTSVKIGMRVSENGVVVQESISDIPVNIPISNFSISPDTIAKIQTLNNASTCQTYTLKNNGTTPINWSITQKPAWLDASATSGTLAVGQTTTVQMCTNSTIATLPTGANLDKIIFKDATSGVEVRRQIEVTVNQCAPVAAISTTPISLSQATNTTTSTAKVLSNTATALCGNLTYQASSSITNGTAPTIETVSNSTKVSIGDSRFRGNVYSVATRTTLTKIESYLNFTGNRDLNFVVLEGDSPLGQFTIVQNQTVTRTGTGAGFYASAPVGQVLQPNKFYIISVGWTGGNIAYHWNDTGATPEPLSFGQRVNGFSQDVFPLANSISYTINAAAFHQRLTTENTWLRVNPSAGSIAAAATANLNIIADATGLATGAYQGTVTVTSNDPTNPTKTIPVNLTVVACSNPVITTQPINTTKNVGETATFSIVATGATSYRWYKTTSPTTTLGTAATFSTPLVSLASAGSYQCEVTNSCGSVLSTVVVLTVNPVVCPNPVITTQPINITKNVGETATFTLAATGAISYRWYKTTSPTTTLGTAATFSTPSVSLASAGSYQCEVSNGCGSVLSNVVVLTVNTVSVDTDGDGISDSIDNCPLTFNPDQKNSDALVTTDLVYWKMEEGTGNTINSSGISATGALVNSPTWVEGHAGTGLQFNGTNQYVNANLPLQGARQATLAAWIKTEVNQSGRRQIISVPRSSGGFIGFEVGFDGPSVNCCLFVSGGGDGCFSSVQNYSDNQWHLIAATYDGNTVKLYWDGNLINSTRNSGALMTENDLVQIGRFGSQGGYFTGAIDEVLVDDRALLSSEIKQLFLGAKDLGDVCDDDDDDDGTPDIFDSCPFDPKKTQLCNCGTTPAESLIIATQPISVKKSIGQSATFTILATGTNVTYRWYKMTNPTTTISTSATLTLPSVSASAVGAYQCEVSISCGSILSKIAQLSLNSNALCFDGNSQYVSMPSATYFKGDFTIEAWIYPRSYNSYSRIIDFGNCQGCDNVWIGFAGTSSNLAIETNSGFYSRHTVAENIPLNQWTHVAFTLTGETVTVYYNGTKVSTGILHPPANITRTANYFGKSNWNQDAYWNGMLDEISISNYAKTQGQIQQNLTTSLSSNETGLVGYWNFDETSGTILQDKTTNAFNGTLVNTPVWVSSDVLFSTYYADTDGDSYGNPSVSREACIQPLGYLKDNTDCDDTKATVHPNAVEIASNGIDDNCDGSIDETINLTFNCPANITVTAAVGQTSAVMNYTAPTASSTCSIGTVTVTPDAANPISGTACPVGTKTLSFTAKDGCGNTKTCSFTITVNPAPTGVLTFNCPVNITVTAAVGQTWAIVNYTAPTASSTCSIGTVTVTPDATNPISGSACPVGTKTVSFTAKDGCGNTKTCSFTITVNPAPTGVLTFNCPANITVTAAVGQTSAVVNYTAPTASSTCSIGTVTVTPDATNTISGAACPVGTKTVSFKATDGCGNTKTCSFTITVNPAPTGVLTLNCPANISVTAAVGQTSAVVNYTAPTSNSTCSIGTVTVTPNAANPASGSTCPVGTKTLSFTATDGCGNTKTCSFTITVNPAPTGVLTFNCPANIAVTAAVGQTSAVVNYTVPTASSTCPIGTTTVTADAANPVSGSAFAVGTKTLSFTATDGCGNTKMCSFTITVNPAPTGVLTFNCPVNIAVTAAVGQTSAVVSYTAPTTSSTCPVGTTTVTADAANPVSGSAFAVGTKTLSFTATDGCGNTKTCSFTITVNPAPTGVLTFNCPVNIAVTAAVGQTSVVINYTAPTASSTCSIGTVTVTPDATNPISGSACPVGTKTVSFTAKDGCGNTKTCSFTITVNPAPTGVLTFNCPVNITVTAAVGQTSAVVNYIAPTASSTCSIGTVTVTPDATNPISGAACPIGTKTLSFKATDGCGNTKTCSFTITVNPAPTGVLTLNCPTNISVTATVGQTSAVVNYIAPTSSSTCSIGTATVTPLATNPASGTAFQVGTKTLSFTAKDGCGNTKTCSFTITVNPAPTGVLTFNCPVNITVTAAVGQTSTVVNYTAPTASSTCSIGTVKVTPNSANPVSGTSFPIGTKTLSFTATDGCGNSKTCTFNVIVIGNNPCLNDTEKPVFKKCPTNISVTTTQSCAKVEWDKPDAKDNCCDPSVSIATAPTTGLKNESCFPIGVTTVTYTATDLKGNKATCSFTVTVIKLADPCAPDVEKPVLKNCPANISLTTSSNCAIANWTKPTATDNCSTPSVSSNYSSGACFPMGTTSVIYTATDLKGNRATCSFTITVTTSNACLPSFDANKCYKIVNKKSGKLLDVYGVQTANNTPLIQWYSTNAANQKWRFTSVGSGYVKIVAQHSGKVVACHQIASNSLVYQYDYYSGGAKDWKIECVNNSSYYKITHRLSGKVLDIKNGSSADGENIFISPFDANSNSQLWQIAEVICPTQTHSLASSIIFDIDGQAEFGRNRVGFTTNQGFRTDYFTIEKQNSKTGEFEKLEIIKNNQPDGNLQYNGIYDNAPNEGDNFYRIKMTYLSGDFDYSLVKNIVNNKEADFTIFPNPARDEVWIDLKAFKGRAIDIILSDIAGKVIHTEKEEKATSAPHRLDVSSIESGAYFITIQTSGKKTVVRKVSIMK